jgi:hypothetical protein
MEIAVLFANGQTLCCGLTLGFCAFLAVTQAEAQPAQSPAEVYQRLTNNPHLKKSPKGEQFCWEARSGMDAFIENYRQTRDTVWLDWGVKYYDMLVANMDAGPDGYRGWIGPQQGSGARWSDVHVGDAILTHGILEFAVLALKEEPQLTAAYGDKARSYVAMACKDVIEKWDKRGTWHEDGPYGAYVSQRRYMEPGDLKKWLPVDDPGRPGFSLPFNMQNDMGVVCLLLYRITGEVFYRDRAEKIFFRMKSCFQYFDNHYVWNYWEPFGPWDIDLEKQVPRAWVNVHGYRNYQAGEINQIVAAYHCGVVFDSTDIQRLSNTNLHVMWNQDRAHPKFVNANNTFMPRTNDQVPDGWKGLAGMLWTGLADFSPMIRGLREVMAGRVATAVDTGQADFTRKHAAGPVAVPRVDFADCRAINMAAVLPCVFRQGEKTLIVNKAWQPGAMEIDLYGADGKNKIAALYKGPVPGAKDGLEGFFIFPWDGTDQAKSLLPGNYRVRWTMGQGYRERAVTVR